MGRTSYLLDASRIKQELERRGWIPRKLAKTAGVSPTTVTRILEYEDEVALPTLVKISKALGINNHMSLVKGYVEPDAPPLEEELEYFVVGFRKNGKLSQATFTKDAVPILTWLLEHPEAVKHAGFLRFAPINSFLVEIELSYDAIRELIIPSFDRGDLEQFGITAVHLPTRFTFHAAYKTEGYFRTTKPYSLMRSYSVLNLMDFWFRHNYGRLRHTTHEYTDDEGLTLTRTAD